MNIIDIKDIRNFDKSPLFYRFLDRIKISNLINVKKPNSIEVSFYQTKGIKPYPHYKPLSKIITINY